MNKRIIASGLGLFILIFVLVILTRRSGATSFSATDVTPTVIPPEILTQIAAPTTLPQTPVPQTPTPYPSLNPSYDPQTIYPPFAQLNGPEQILAGKLEGSIAGHGVLFSSEAPFLSEGADAGAYELQDLSWEQWTYDSFINVWAGQMRETPSQGVVWVQIMPHYNPHQDIVIVKSPVPAGGLTIVGAVGERLILESDQGQTFYFDVPALRFVETLDEEVPTATPISPTTSNASQETSDDAPDVPFHVDVNDVQPENTNVSFFINSPNDSDWFYFNSRKPGTIKVSLIPRTGNYGLRVVWLENELGEGQIVGEDLAGSGQKKITISDAASGNYLVRVWSLDGSYSESQPYTLRFDAPEPENVIPILECVAENADGTYTAHFGYENPNPFVVVVDAEDHQNKFEPPPTFRTGQPESFAPGRVEDWFSILFDGNGLTWVLDGGAVTANRNSPRCP
jgi:hypothetical protein